MRREQGGIGQAAVRLAAGCVAAALWVGVGHAQTQAAAPPAGSGAFGFLNGLDRSSTLFGDMWGLRPLLSRYGMTFNLQETSEAMGNVSGGVRRGADYDGLTQMSLQLDTQRAFGWYGGTFNVSAEQIHGRSLSADNLATLQTASGIEADRATRLWELWYQQKLLDEDRLDIKIGQQSLDQEFMVSQNAGAFVNTMFGWPMVPSADLPGGGPAYPLSALGVRLRAHLADSLTLLAGVFNGSPVRNNAGDPQRQNPSGISFPLNGGVLAIAELQYAYPSLNTMVSADEGEPLGRTYRLGAYYDSERFADLRTNTAGQSLADGGVPRSHTGDFALYAVADRMLWRDFKEPDRNVNAFLRLLGAPQADRNLITFSMNAGITMHEPFMGRDDDTAGFGIGYAQVSRQARGLDQDTLNASGLYTPLRSGETYLEATYQYEVAPWLQLQPDVQYVFMPGGGTPDPTAPGKRVQNELVFGLRSNIQF